jgi:hypothetical protein
MVQQYYFDETDGRCRRVLYNEANHYGRTAVIAMTWFESMRVRKVTSAPPRTTVGGACETRCPTRFGHDASK